MRCSALWAGRAGLTEWSRLENTIFGSGARRPGFTQGFDAMGIHKNEEFE